MGKKIEFVMLADTVNPKTGKTYREENMEKKHNIPLGSLVDVIETDFDSDLPTTGLRLYVVAHNRDCDGTPLYGLSWEKNWSADMYGKSLRFAATAMVTGGYPESVLRVAESTDSYLMELLVDFMEFTEQAGVDGLRKKEIAEFYLARKKPNKKL